MDDKYPFDAATILAAGAASAVPFKLDHEIGDPAPFVVVPAGYEVKDLEDMLLAPARKRGTFQFNDVDSFIAYCDEHTIEGSAIFASRAKTSFTMQFNGHRPAGEAPGWVRDLRDMCERTGVPFLFKQWGAWAPAPSMFWAPGKPQMVRSGDAFMAADGRTHIADHDLSCSFEGEATIMQKVGKKAAGRLLDGREHNEFPVQP